MGLLVCTKCKIAKPADTTHFPPHNKKKNGLDSWCRACRSSYRNEINRGKFRGNISDDDLRELKSTCKRCIICGSDSALVVDHCHKTGTVRGILCSNCNLGLGHFKDDPMLLEFAMQYLNCHQCPEDWEKYKDSHAADPPQGC